MEDLVTTDTEKAEVFNNFFVSFFTGSYSSHITWVPESQGKNWGNEVLKVRLDSALSVPCCLCSFFFLYSSLTAEHAVDDMEYPFGQWSTVLAVFPSNFFTTLSLLTGRRSGKERRLWCCPSTAQQQPKHLCGINTVFLMFILFSIPPNTRKLQPAVRRNENQDQTLNKCLKLLNYD